MILDAQIPTADPGEVIVQFTPWIHRIARRYVPALEQQQLVDLDDLLQAGRIAVFNCQKTYDPGKCTFLSYSKNWIRSAMRRALGFKNDGTLPDVPMSLDSSLADDSDAAWLDFVPDTTPTAEENIIERDRRNETAEAVHAAVDRLKNAKQREVITRCWLNEQPKPEAAEEMGINIRSLQMVDLEARHKLRRDKELKTYAALQFPFMHVGPGRFRSTWTSATEKAVMWRERRYDEQYGPGAFLAAGAHDQRDVQTSKWMEERVWTASIL